MSLEASEGRLFHVERGEALMFPYMASGCDLFIVLMRVWVYRYGAAGRLHIRHANI